ncbi:thioredoxin family protein [Helicobacter pylori]|uniref:thioredoxin family protein n=1 Tax=Helicobacter pylori TaxID=210 RepID=UPI0023517E57|nr:thioredoxin family protein [Helicobacter pylori]
MSEIINGKNYAEKIAHQAVVVNVGASWCTDCRKIEPIMENLAKTYKARWNFLRFLLMRARIKRELRHSQDPYFDFLQKREEVGERLVEPGSSKPIEDAIKTLL